MRLRAYVSIIGVAAVAAVSAALLWWMLFVQGSLGHLGLAGLFLASMLSHLTIVARDMFVPVFLPLTSVYNPVYLGASAGCGAAIGEVTAYFLGWGVAESVMDDQRAEDDRVARWISKYGLLAVLLVSVTPLPDTPVILFAGSRQLSFKKLLIVEGTGKTAYYTFMAFVGGFVFTGMKEIMGGLTASLLVVAASVAFCVLVTWGRSRNIIYGWVERLVP